LINIAINLQIRRDTSANWTSNNPTLAEGEFGFETDTKKIKIGDGSLGWISLEYFPSSLEFLGDVDIMTPSDNNVLTWDSATNKWSSQASTAGGISGWEAYTGGTGIGGMTGTYAISGDGALSISVKGYSNISGNATSGQVAQKHLLDSGAKYHNAYASAQRVNDLFNHEIYSLSSNLYNQSWIDTFSGNVDTRIDAAGGTLAGVMVGNISGSSYSYGLQDIDFVSSQAISGGHITTSYTAAAGTDVVNKTYGDANYIGAATLAGNLVGNLSGASYAYGLKDMDFVSSQAISGGTYKHLQYPADYVVFKDGGNYYNKRGRDGLIYNHAHANNVIQNAIDGCPIGGRIVITSGSYLIRETINIIDKSITLEGVGWGWTSKVGSDIYGTTQLRAGDDADNHPYMGKFLISCASLAPANMVQNVQIKNMLIDGWGNTNKGARGGLVVSNIQHGIFDNLMFMNFNGSSATSYYPNSGIGILMKGPGAGGCYYNEVRNCNFRFCTVGIHVSSNSNNHTFYNNHFAARIPRPTTYRYGIFVEEGAACSVYGPGDFESYSGSRACAIYFDSGAGASNWNFFNPRFEGGGKNLWISKNSNNGQHRIYGGSDFSNKRTTEDWFTDKCITSRRTLVRGFGAADNIWDIGADYHVSAQVISGSWTTPIHRGAGKPAASVANEGQIIRTSGGTSEKTYVWISVINDAGTYEWLQLAVST